MIIYQIYKYKDFNNYVVGSFLNKARAEEEKTKLEMEENVLIAQSIKCGKCPYLYDSYLTNEELKSYCDKADLHNYGYSVDCVNYYEHWDEATFEIKEVEVEE